MCSRLDDQTRLTRRPFGKCFNDRRSHAEDAVDATSICVQEHIKRTKCGCASIRGLIVPRAGDQAGTGTMGFTFQMRNAALQVCDCDLSAALVIFSK